jgi:hypothetical protein
MDMRGRHGGEYVENWRRILIDVFLSYGYIGLNRKKPRT